MGYIITMNNELMDMIRVSCDECVCDAAEAQIEHERGEHERARAEIWAALEAQHGPLCFRNGCFEYAEYEGMAWKD
jgi:hypothetical protein